jgi:hypothetical protein
MQPGSIPCPDDEGFWYGAGVVEPGSRRHTGHCTAHEPQQEVRCLGLCLSRRWGSRPVVGVLGCMAERLKQQLLDSNKLVDIVAGPDAYRDLPRLIAAVDVRRRCMLGCGPLACWAPAVAGCELLHLSGPLQGGLWRLRGVCFLKPESIGFCVHPPIAGVSGGWGPGDGDECSAEHGGDIRRRSAAAARGILPAHSGAFRAVQVLLLHVKAWGVQQGQLHSCLHHEAIACRLG